MVVVAIVTVMILMVGWVLSGVWHWSQEGLRELREEIAELKQALSPHTPDHFVGINKKDSPYRRP